MSRLQVLRDSSRLRLRTKSRMHVVRRLALYLRAGIPIVRAIELIEEDACERSTARMLSDISGDMRRGIPLSQACARFPQTFEALHVQLIAVGEASGTLADSLDHLADTLARRADLHRKIAGALAYPLVILVGTLSVSGFLIFYAFPKVIPLFRGLHVQLPFTTRALIWISSFITAYAVLLAALCIPLIAGFPRVLRLPRVRSRVDASLLRVPLIGSVLQSYYLATIFRTLSILLRSGVRIDVALAHTRKGVSHAGYARSIGYTERVVLEGGTLSNALRTYPAEYPMLVIQLIVAGEMTGTLSQSAQTISELFESELESQLKTLSALIEPILMLVMGLLVGFIALAIISPMYSLTQSLSTY